MSKKTRRKSKQPAKPEPAPPVVPTSSGKAFWRRNGLIVALGLFIFSNVALRAVDTRALPPSAFLMIGLLTVLSIGLTGAYGLQYLLASRRARLEGWGKREWEGWRNGHG
jgi:uncharacterized membrane protein